MKVLFILKRRSELWGYTGSAVAGYPSGLLNSAAFVSAMLPQIGVESKLVEVVDNDGIDREVALFHPDVVIIEALWVVPGKFEVLTRLHPRVKWIVRNHSEIPFLALEGVGLDWMLQYPLRENVFISSNRKSANDDFTFLLGEANPKQPEGWAARKCVYLPNYYPATIGNHEARLASRFVDIACFGAVRPLKNIALQAVAAMRFADAHGFKLRFHINASRVECQGEPVLKSLRAMFGHFTRHQLVEHAWMPHAEFKKLCATMDIGMQVSFTETFNIVAADLADENVPVVVSTEIGWVTPELQVAQITSESILATLQRAWSERGNLAAANKRNLARFATQSKHAWKEGLSSL